MRIHASAPGKLVLSGEYAVLEGAPALVLAVDARARVTLDDAHGDMFRVRAPDIDVAEAQFGFDDDGCMRWIGTDAAQLERLDLIARIIQSSPSQRPFAARLDTSAFLLDNRKIGLGSSAALTVALAGALCVRARGETPPVEKLIALHREWQRGRGSGLDVAASFHGGLLIYRLREDEPEIGPVSWPRALHWCCVWSGRSASTVAQLNRLAAWRARAPGPYAEHMAELRRIAEAIVDAAVVDDGGRFLEAIAAYAERLHVFGKVTGLEIFSGGHEQAATFAARCDVVYKPCGAGGGDIGIALTQDPDRLSRFRRDLARSHCREVVLQRAACGLQVSDGEFEPHREAHHDHAGRHVTTMC